MQARSGLSPHGSVASRPVHAKMVLLLYVNEAGHATRATQRPSFFVRMRFGEEGESEFVLHSANFASSVRHAEDAVVRRSDVLEKNGLNIMDIFLKKRNCRTV
ncbi:hypothetical protein Baya_13692 [Bagarius yarrelli]|uniref:Uncharacterized protein n=1 Tax=Bagarius yarrelli TaxID=175774 RepID=A0A556V6Q0_BAGYA|nr:hypothetical protein Baya_13692 [Bagarius yarrelli]